MPLQKKGHYQDAFQVSGFRHLEYFGIHFLIDVQLFYLGNNIELTAETDLGGEWIHDAKIRFFKIRESGYYFHRLTHHGCGTG